MASDHRPCHPRPSGRAAETKPPTSELRQASRPPAGWVAPLRQLRREAGQLPAAEAGPWLRLPEGREPRLPGARRIAAEPLEAYVEGYVIDQWQNPRALKIAQSDDDRMERIAKISR